MSRGHINIDLLDSYNIGNMASRNANSLALPKQAAQLKAESDSYAILLYHLRGIGIFRNLTDNDYGIDFEIELVNSGSVTANYVKAQVKAADRIRIRQKDNVPTVGGVKESTLNYWCELSRKTHVIAYAVDLNAELIYVSCPLFWQATRLLNGDGKRKTIEFRPSDASTVAENRPRAVAATLLAALAPPLLDELYAMSSAMRRLADVFTLYDDVFAEDPGLEVSDMTLFQAFLEWSGILLWEWMQFTTEGEQQRPVVQNLATKAANRVPGPTNTEARTVMRALMPRFLESLATYRQRILGADYYWSRRASHYLVLVNQIALPLEPDHNVILDWAANFEQRARERKVEYRSQSQDQRSRKQRAARKKAKKTSS